jgi:hypothetical protein
MPARIRVERNTLMDHAVAAAFCPQLGLEAGQVKHAHSATGVRLNSAISALVERFAVNCKQSSRQFPRHFVAYDKSIMKGQMIKEL